MTREEAAAALNGCEYHKEGSRELFAQMKDAGLVAVFGASDDLMEFRGAISDEVGAYGGTSVNLTPAGLLVNKCGEGDGCPNWKPGQIAGIDALWCIEDSGPSWTYEADFPTVPFDVMEDGEVYCRGVVFALADAVPA